MKSYARRIIKYSAIIMASLLVIFGLELARERFVYRRISQRIERAHAQIKPGMTKDEVRQIAGAPEEVIMRKPDEYWRWSAREHQGELWKRIGLSTIKGHYDLIVMFDGENRIKKIFGGVN
jgi:outer membrane protein assembly factor BamE (lipoprotein component of BamABCDE complex)